MLIVDGTHVSSSSTSIFGLLPGLGWPKNKYYGIAIAKACRAFFTPKNGKKRKAWPRSRRTNTRASQLIIIDGAKIIILELF